MKICAVVPLNAPGQAKSRLAQALSGHERAALVRWMAGRVLAALRESGAVAEVAVISPSPALLAWVAARGAQPLRQWTGDLNDGLELGRRWALARGADALLVLLGDLPYLAGKEVADLAGMVQSTDERRLVVLAPDGGGHGTNGLLMRPLDALPFGFGPESLARHARLAADAGLDPLWYASYGTAHDLDTPDDLRALIASGRWTPRTGGGAEGGAGVTCGCERAPERARARTGVGEP